MFRRDASSGRAARALAEQRLGLVVFFLIHEHVRQHRGRADQGGAGGAYLADERLGLARAAAPAEEPHDLREEAGVGVGGPDQLLLDGIGLLLVTGGPLGAGQAQGVQGLAGLEAERGAGLGHRLLDRPLGLEQGGEGGMRGSVAGLELERRPETAFAARQVRGVVRDRGQDAEPVMSDEAARPQLRRPLELGQGVAPPSLRGQHPPPHLVGESLARVPL